MKQTNFTFLIIIGFAAVIGEPRSVAQTNAQPRSETTLEALIAATLEKNPELKFYEAEIAAAKGDIRSAVTRQNPELNSELGYKRVSGGGLSAEGVAWSVSVMQPFDYPGRIALRKMIANRQIELAELGYERFRSALAARVRILGYRVLVAQEKADAAQSVADRGQELVEVLVQRDPAGIAPLLETRIIEANVIVAKKRAGEASKEAQVALYELNQLRGETLNTPLRVAKTTLNFSPRVAAEVLLATARTNNFEIRTRQIELAQQGLRVDLSRNEKKPPLSAGPFYSQEGGDETERVVGVGISLPLPLWNRNEGGIETAKARQQQAEASLNIAQRQVERELLEAIAAYDALFKQMSFWRADSLAQLREAAELGDRHYRLGALPISTYTELQEKFLEATEAILDTEVEALENLQQIELLTGRELPVATTPQEVAK